MFFLSFFLSFFLVTNVDAQFPKGGGNKCITLTDACTGDPMVNIPVTFICNQTGIDETYVVYTNQLGVACPPWWLRDCAALTSNVPGYVGTSSTGYLPKVPCITVNGKTICQNSYNSGNYGLCSTAQTSCDGQLDIDAPCMEIKYTALSSCFGGTSSPYTPGAGGFAEGLYEVQLRPKCCDSDVGIGAFTSFYFEVVGAPNLDWHWTTTDNETVPGDNGVELPWSVGGISFDNVPSSAVSSLVTTIAECGSGGLIGSPKLSDDPYAAPGETFKVTALEVAPYELIQLLMNEPGDHCIEMCVEAKGPCIEGTVTSCKQMIMNWDNPNFAPNSDQSYARKKKQNSSDIGVFPNPFRNEIEVSSLRGIEKISVFGIDGRLIKDVYPEMNTKVAIDLNNLNESIYFLQITDEDGKVINRKIIKQ